MIRAVVFALVVACATAAFLPVVDVDRSFPVRDEFDRPIYTLGDKAAFDVRTKTLRTEQDVPIVPVAPVAPVAYHAAPVAYHTAPIAYRASPLAVW
ncbi:uncharacterized protein LOC119095901 [Pollicipes pollicipes]|uniref:uncharacterized protein LOC119095767 n=1 Tax=Pollicipes pollicipes TaxID=41117 RepID=UPI001884F065|nr:uncharacterized protein LOC119095767 [Pollicipes pollicipes]XP_037074655.1 uncharacterized protein LOC119095901 [Pollicipes pollicipes]